MAAQRFGDFGAFGRSGIRLGGAAAERRQIEIGIRDEAVLGRAAGEPQRVAELPHVSRERIGQQHRPGRGRKPAIRRLLACDQRDQVGPVGALPQGGQSDFQAPQPVVKIRAKAAGLRHAAEIAMGCADEADVDGHRLQRPERPDLAIFQHAQQARLQRDRHVADLVKEQRSAVGLHNQAFRSVAPRAGEGAGLITEQFGIDQALRHRRTIERYIVLPRATARGMDGAREYVLADTGLAAQQDRQVVIADALQTVHAPDQHRIAAGELVQAVKPACRNFAALHRWKPRRFCAERRRHVPLPQQAAVGAMKVDAAIRHARGLVVEPDDIGQC